MKRYGFGLILIVAALCGSARAQCPGNTPTTPNLGLYIPAQNQQNWGYCLNSSLSMLDSFLSGVTPLPSLTVNGTTTVNNIVINGTCTGSGCTSGSGVTLETNGTSNSSQSILNLLNSSVVNGLTYTFANGSGGNVTLGVTGTYTGPAGAAATAASIATNGTANQVWGMNSGGSAQGWQNQSGGGTTVNNISPVAHQWLNSFNAPNFTQTQPAFTDISGTLGIGAGGTGQTGANAAFNALSPMTTEGDIIYYHSGVATRLAVGTNTQCIVSNGADPGWGACSAGSAPTLQTNGSNNSSQSSLNLLNSAATNGLTYTFTNTTGGNVQLGVSGTYTGPAGLASTATAAASAGTECSSGQSARGVDASWNAKDCFTPSGVSAGSQYGVQYSADGTGGFGAVTPPTTNGDYQVTYHVTGGAAVAPTARQTGLLARGVGGTTSTDTILYSDANNAVEYGGSVAVAVTLPTPTTLGNTNFYTIMDNRTTGSSTALTITPTTWTINGGATLTVANGQKCRISIDPNTSTNWLGLCGEPPIVAGTNVTVSRTPAGITINSSAASGTVNTGTGGAPAVYLTTGTAVSGGSGETFNGSGVLQNVKGASSGTTAAYGDAGTTTAFSQNPGYFGYNTTDTAWEMMTAWQDNSSPALDLQAAYATSQDRDDQNTWNLQYWPVQIAGIEHSVANSYAWLASLGDSDTSGFGTTPPQLSWLYPFVTMAESTSTGWGNAGVGYVTSNPVGALKNALPVGVTGAVNGSWIYCGWSGGTVTNGIGGTCLGPDATHAAAGANGAYQQITATGTNFFVHAACQSGGASLHIIVDSVDTANASTNCSTPGVVSVASGNLTEGSHVIQAEQVGSGTLVFTGFYGYDTTLGHGIGVLKMAAASTSAIDFATNPNLGAELTQIQADLVATFGTGITTFTEMTGANENNQAKTPAAMITAINTIVGDMATAAPLADIMVMSDPDDGNNAGLTASGWQYEKAIQGYDNKNRYPFVSFFRHTYPESINSPSNRGCFATDNIHLGANCQQGLAKIMLLKMNSTLTNPYAGSSGSGTINYIAKWTSSSVLGNSQLDDGATNANTLTYVGAGGGAFPNGPLTIATVLKIKEGSVPSGATGYGFIGAAASTHLLGFSNAGGAYANFVGSAAALCSTCIVTGGGVQLAQTPNSSSTLDSSGNMTVAGKYNGLTLSGLTGGFSIAGGTSSKTLTIDNTLELAGTDSTKMTFPASSATVAGLGITETFTAPQTFAPSGTAVPIIATGDAASSDVLDVNQHGGSSGNAFKVDHSGNVTAAGNGTFGSAAATAAIGLNTTSGSNSLTTTSGANGYTWTLPANTGTFAELGFAQTWSAVQTFGTNISIGGVTAAGATGTSNVVFSNSPTLVTPALGAATATSLLASGIVDGTAPITLTTGASCTLGTGSGCNSVAYNSGYTFNQEATAATAITYTLPTAAAGKQYCVSNSYNGSAATTGTLELLTSASGQFIIFTDGTLSATGGYVISGGAGGDAACVVGVDSTHWQLYVQNGTWGKH